MALQNSSISYDKQFVATIDATKVIDISWNDFNKKFQKIYSKKISMIGTILLKTFS